MSVRRDQFKSSYGAFSARERELARSRALRDARDASDAAAERSAGSAAHATPTEGVAPHAGSRRGGG
ncbi:hypothetical protein [Roseisolibacter sp. H3M3-2]|uniref:hypothetical protein n=1 Tax=Roseisolibacter sp. H3M3-2 TaxID=3031323 RepID=UPI0023DB0B3F|nr:hypothetical protein [Roseisolibacter sp. H3M3-2]MDF1506297.1 hypothetical protein [Roseisolibacter sp. H3M3-2]